MARRPEIELVVRDEVDRIMHEHGGDFGYGRPIIQFIPRPRQSEDLTIACTFAARVKGEYRFVINFYISNMKDFTPEDWRETTIHEMAHVASWSVAVNDPHGPLWQFYCRKYGWNNPKHCRMMPVLA